jgi:HD-GYP domain-containing protein (c-di-GMP phosphodiesterase class II)
MVRYGLDDIQDGMVLGESIVLPTGKLLLGSGYQLTKHYKDRLQDLGYRSLLIQEPGTEDVRPETLVADKSQNELTDSMEDMGKKLNSLATAFRAKTSQDIHKMIFKHRQDINKHIMNPGIAKQLEDIIEQVLSQNNVVLNLAALKKTSGSFFDRAVNVAVTALCIGKKNNFSFDENKQLAVGALNYHIGLTALPRQLLEKNAPLTEEEQKEYRQHTTFGYLMLAQNSQIAPVSQIVALQHHELQNGTGYPLGLKGSNRPPQRDISQTHVIHRFAEIVAVADTYHAILPDNHTSNPSSIKDIIAKMIKLSGIYLNSEIVKTLISVVPMYPVGARIRITDAPNAQLKKYIGVVAKDNPQELSRPQILLYETSTHKKINPPIVIDTAKAPSISFELLT